MVHSTPANGASIPCGCWTFPHPAGRISDAKAPEVYPPSGIAAIIKEQGWASLIGTTTTRD